MWRYCGLPLHGRFYSDCLMTFTHGWLVGCFWISESMLMNSIITSTGNDQNDLERRWNSWKLALEWAPVAGMEAFAFHVIKDSLAQCDGGKSLHFGCLVWKYLPSKSCSRAGVVPQNGPPGSQLVNSGRSQSPCHTARLHGLNFC